MPKTEQNIAGARPAAKLAKFWSVEITDHHPILGGKTVKFPFAFRAHAERWAKDEVSAAKQFGMDCSYKVNQCAA